MDGGELNQEEVKALKEVFLSQQEEYEQYKETSEKKMKAYVNENTDLYNQINELKEKNSQMELEIIRLKETTENLEQEKQINEEQILENKEEEDNKVNDYINEIHNLQIQLDESQRKIKEITEKNRETQLNERLEYDLEDYSLWWIEYQNLPEEGKVLFRCSNSKGMFLQKLDTFRKYAFAVHGVYGTEGDYKGV